MYIVIDRIITELLILILNKYLRKFQEKKERVKYRFLPIL